MDNKQKDVIVGEQWLVLSKIGQGSFGEVFKVQDLISKQLFAIKREPLDLEHPQLYHEHKIYSVLKHGPGIPTCHWYGQFDGFDCIVIDLLGTSLKQFQETVCHIPLDVVIDLGCQLITCLEFIHDKGIVYRDMKPENILFSASCLVPSSYYQPPIQSPPPSPPSCRSILNSWDKSSVYLVDFGLANYWRHPKTKKPYPECKKPLKYKTGTARYASLNVHRGRTHARRDDMESLGYVLLDLLLDGQLPWSGITAKTCKQGWDSLLRIKEDMSLHEMCLGLPQGILHFIDYTRRLRYNDRPDYDYLRRVLRGCHESGPFSKIVSQRKRENSHESYLKSQTKEQDVFKMDDLVRELPKHKSFYSSTTPRRQRYSSSSVHKKYSGWNVHQQWEK
ncbi:hypothetical protein CU098_004452 [Rhizopus stolonifer]|uniref:non-specific serine/threonine protein kinase n=1 Tax=Rhizopus stolonifer TaxID=4846 RepID=A0A367KRS8_RHIST|nr:hypothetical protein CU098_004452 [Rhizopus stolonifer]